MSTDFKPAAAEIYLANIRQVAERGERDRAIGLLQNLTTLDTEYGPAWEEMGTLLLAAGRKEEALTAFEKAAKAPQRTPNTLKRFASLALEQGRVEEAARAYERILSRFPSDLDALLSSAFLRLRLGQFEQVENLVVRVLTVAPQDPQARAFLQTLQTSKQPAATSVDGPFSCDVSIIIPSFNNAPHVRRCLESIHRHTGDVPFELVIVDNSSNQETRDYLAGAARTYPRLNLVNNAVNLGFARACNQGSRAARGKHLLFLNNDTEVQPGWLRPLVDTLEKDAKVGAVGAKLLFPNGTVQHAGVLIINNQTQDVPLTATHIALRSRADDPQANERRACQAVTAACMLIRRTAFTQAGGFDESYWNGFEDVDLNFKLGEKGWLRIYEPLSVVIHHEMQGGPERTVRFNQNLQHLSDRWVGKIVPDVIYTREGQFVFTNGGGLHRYERPA
jgi:GT2 family glycosyltransferase/Flp pilus assembly protein TadD